MRRVKKDDAFDIDPAVGMADIFALVFRRAVMAGRGLILAARCRRCALPLFVGRGVVVTSPRFLQLGAGVTLGDYCRLDCLGTKGIKIGDAVTLRRGVHIEVTSVLRELGEGCVLGDRVGISEGTFIGAKGLLTIGDDTIIGPQCTLVAEDHVFAATDRPIREQGVTRAGVAIGSDCWFGAGVRVLDGVAIGRGCVVGAGAVVTRDLPDMSVAAGVPARVVGVRS